MIRVHNGIGYRDGILVNRNKGGSRITALNDPGWDIPPVQAGLTCCFPLIGTAAPSYSAAGTTDFSTKTVDADWTRKRETDDLIVQAAANTPRFERYGVRVDPTRTNLCLQSEDFDTTWTAVSGVSSARDETSPDGTANDAWTLTDANAAAYSAKRQAIAVAADTTVYCMSVFIKKTTSASTHPCIEMTFGATNYRVILNTDDGTTTVAGDAPSAHSAESWDANWWRVWMAAANVSEASLLVLLYPAASSNGTTLSVAAQGDCVAWGAQVEAGSAPSSYIPTTTASKQAAADDLDLAYASNFSLTSGTLSVVVTVDGLLGASQYIADIYVDANDRISLYLDSTGKPKVDVVDGGSTTASLTATSALTAGTTAIITVCWTANDVRLYVDGSDEKSDTSCTMPSGSATVFLGQSGGNATQLGGVLSYLIGHDRALSAAGAMADVKWTRGRLGLTT